MSQGKKYNIWIAYSDLFTNLSTFLFISALGVFAALGSGRFPTPGLGAQSTCSVPAEAEQGLLKTPEGSTQPPSLVARLRSSNDPPLDCVRYYRLGTARFASSDASLNNFRNPPDSGNLLGRPVAPADILSRICQPIWLLISRRDFKSHEGRVVLRGIPSPDGDGWAQLPQQCEQREQEPKIRNWGVPENESQIGYIRACGRNVHAFNFCGEILNCLNRREGDRNLACQRVVAVEQWNRRATLACHEQAVRQQAQTIHRFCEAAPAHSNFQDQLYQRDVVTFVEEARYEDTRGVLWEQVSFDPHTRSSQSSPLDALPAGSIALEVRYSR